MPKNVIAITAYNKPDLLFIYLEQIYKENIISNFLVRIFTEEGFDTDTKKVVEFYKRQRSDVDIQIVIRKKHPTCPLVGFHNILTSYILAAKESSEYVIVGEEDMLPTDDYLKFNDYAYRHFLSKYDKIFCVAHKRRVEIEKDGNPEILIGDYQCTSPSCVSVKSINKWMAPYFSDPLYFNDPILFNLKYFPASRISPQEHTHHDGAIERIMWANKLFSIKPDQSRSMHVGLSGIFCKGAAPAGELFQKVKRWRVILQDRELLRSLSSIPQEMALINFHSPEWKELKLDTNRNLAQSSSWWYDTDNEFKRYVENI